MGLLCIFQLGTSDLKTVFPAFKGRATWNMGGFLSFLSNQTLVWWKCDFSNFPNQKINDINENSSKIIHKNGMICHIWMRRFRDKGILNSPKMTSISVLQSLKSNISSKNLFVYDLYWFEGVSGLLWLKKQHFGSFRVPTIGDLGSSDLTIFVLL